jgi:hypothetical protein
MTRRRTPAALAAGKLISSIQKVWDYRTGTEQAADAEAVMNRAHDIYQAILCNRLSEVLAGRSLRDYLGRDWVSCHPGVQQGVARLEVALLDQQTGNAAE